MTDLRTQLLDLEEKAAKAGILDEGYELALANVRVLVGYVEHVTAKKHTIPILVGRERCGGVGAYARDLAGNPYGQCFVCGGTYKLTKNGCLYNHRAPMYK